MKIDKDPESIWFWADPHFGHTNIIGYSNRPFKDVAHMDQALIDNYNALVSNDDMVFWLGDIGWYKWDKLKTYVSRCKGKKFLIRGNHDKAKYSEYLELFKEVHEQILLKVGKNSIILNHYPMLVWEKSIHGSMQLHGHTHQSSKFTEHLAIGLNNKIYTTYNHNRICVGVEAWDYKPVNLATLLSFRTKNIPLRDI